MMWVLLWVALVLCVALRVAGTVAWLGLSAVPRVDRCGCVGAGQGGGGGRIAPGSSEEMMD